MRTIPCLCVAALLAFPLTAAVAAPADPAAAGGERTFALFTAADLSCGETLPMTFEESLACLPQGGPTDMASDETCGGRCGEGYCICTGSDECCDELCSICWDLCRFIPGDCVIISQPVE